MMRGNLKKWMALMLSTTMLAACMTGCGSEEKEAASKNEPAKEEAAVENTEVSEEASGYQTTYGSKQFDDVTIKVELWDRSNAPEGSTITDNKWVDYVNQEMGKVGIKVEFVPVPRSDEMSKMQTMVASQTAPDITITYSYATAEDYFKQGGIWNLAPFIDGEDQAKNIKEYIGKDVLNIARTPDNELYGIVARRATTAACNMYLRKDWLDKLGLAIPTTPDELYHVIDQMVNNNPDGMKEVIGLEPWMFYNLRIAFSQVTEDPLMSRVASGADYITEYADPGSKEYYRFLNKAYNNGLMHKEYFALNEDQFKSYIVTGALACFEANVNFAADPVRGNLVKTLQDNVPGAELISLPALKNPNDGKQYSSGYCPGGLIAFCPLTADEETVEACMTYLDWMCTKEGGFAIYHGFEGEHFEYNEDGVPIAKDVAYNAKDKDWLRQDLFLTGNSGYFATAEEFNASQAAEAPGFEEFVTQSFENSLSGTVINAEAYSSPSTSELTTDLGLVRDEYKVSCVTCPEDEFEATYAEYMSELEKAGIQKIIDERIEYFSSME